MKKWRSLLACVCTLALVAILCPLSPSVAAASFDWKLTDIAALSADDIALYNNQSWGLGSGQRVRETVDGQAYLHYTNAAAYGKARVTLAAERQNWTGGAYLTFPVINNTAAEQAVMPFLVLGEVLAAPGAAIQGATVDDASTAMRWNQGYLIIPQGFAGTVRMPVSTQASDYAAIEGGTVTWTGMVQAVGCYFNDWAATDLSIGDYRLVYEDGTATAAAGAINDISAYTKEQVEEYNDQSWGLPAGQRTRVTRGGQAFLRYTNAAAYGKAYTPPFSEKNQDFRDVETITFRAVNLLSTPAPLLPLFLMAEGPLAPVADVTVTAEVNGQTVTLDRDQNYVILPAHFDGVVRIPVPADAASYFQIEADKGTWNAAAVERLGFFFNDWGSVDVLIGEYVPVRKDGGDATTTAGAATTTKPAATTTAKPTAAPTDDRVVLTDFAHMTAEQLKNGVGQDWGLPQGTMSLADIAGVKHLRVKTTAEGKAILPALTVTDWNGVITLDIPVVNNGGDAAFAPYFAMQQAAGDPIPFIHKEGAAATFVSGGKSEVKTFEGSCVTVPAGFKGTLRFSIPADGSGYGVFWGQGSWNIGGVTMVSLFFPGAADLSFGDFALTMEAKGGDGPTATTTTATTTKTTKPADTGRVVLTDFARMTADQLKNGVGQDWGLPQGTMSLADVAGAKYLRVKTAAEGKAILPAFAKTDWTGAASLDIPVVNNSTEPAAFAPYLYIEQANGDLAPYILKAGVTVTFVSGGKNETKTFEGSCVTVPAGFNGTLRFPVPADGSSYGIFWGAGSWNIRKVAMAGLFFQGAADLSFGDFTLTMGGQETTKHDKPAYRLVTDFAGMTADQLKNGVGQDWGLPAGSMELKTISGAKWLHITSEGEGKAILPAFTIQDWSGVKFLEIPVVNHSNAPVAIAPYFGVGQNGGSEVTAPFIAKPKQTFVLISGGRVTTQTPEDSLVLLPAGFNGVLRMPISKTGAEYGLFWGTGSWDITHMILPNLYLKAGGDVSMGDWRIYSEGSIQTLSPQTGHAGAPVLPAVAVVFAALALVTAALWERKTRRAR